MNAIAELQLQSASISDSCLQRARAHPLWREHGYSPPAAVSPSPSSDVHSAEMARTLGLLALLGAAVCVASGERGPLFAWSSVPSDISEGLRLSSRAGATRDAVTEAIDALVGDAEAVVVFLGHAASARDLRGSAVEEAMEGSSASAAFAALDAPRDVALALVERLPAVVDASCGVFGGPRRGASVDLAGPAVLVACGRGPLAEEDAQLRALLDAVAAETPGGFVTVYVGGGEQPRVAERRRLVVYTSDCGAKCRAQVAAVEAFVVLVVLAVFMLPAFGLLGRLQSPTKLEKAEEQD